MPVYRCNPEDFEVEEQLAYQPSGVGDHVYLWVEKRERTSDQVAGQIARAAGCRASDVGYAGRKDRYAIARQWFSAPGLDPGSAGRLELDGAVVLGARRHSHRLRTGKLKANRFRLVVRSIDPSSIARLERRLAALARWGFANRFGTQRFGAAGDNADRGRELLERGARPRDRRAARFLVSALQSAVFNRLLERRAELFGASGPGDLENAGRRPVDRLLTGDLAMKTDSGGVFEVLEPEVEQPRADAAEISPTGLLFGRKARLAGGVVGELERAVLGEWRLGQTPRIRGLRFDGARRCLREHPADLAWSFEAPSAADSGAADRREQERALQLCFGLASGSYASVLLEELFEGLDLVEAAPNRYPGGSIPALADRATPDRSASGCPEETGCEG